MSGTTVKYRTPTEKGMGNVLVGVTGVIGIDAIVNLLQGDFIVAGVHGLLGAITWSSSGMLKGAK